ncbi:MAG: hypothetical protein IJX91_01890 [Clostridia bacterium]|nr:hypothetical protein [Clostridia bacterium]
MKKSAYISDILFTFFTAAVFTLCLFRYLGIDLVPALFLALICGALAAAAIGAWLTHKRRRFFLKRSDEALKQKLLLHLSLLSDEKKSALFYNVLRQREDVKRMGKLRLVGQENFYFLNFRFSPVTPDEVAAISRLKTQKQKILLCNEIEESALRLCARLNIQVRAGDDVFRLLRAENALPKTYLGEDVATKKSKFHLRACFAKSNSRRFLVGGALILLSSLITPFPYYYLVSGTLLLVAAACIRIFGYS